MYFYNNILPCVALLFAVAACTDRPTFREDTVWDLYDVRTPVPASSGVSSRATYADPVNARSPAVKSSPTPYPRDYDSYYVPPTGNFGSCGEGGIAAFNCD